MQKFTACEKARILKFRDLEQRMRKEGETFDWIAAMSDDEYIEYTGQSDFNLIQKLGNGCHIKTVEVKQRVIRWAINAGKSGEVEMSELPNLIQEQAKAELEQEASAIN